MNHKGKDGILSIHIGLTISMSGDVSSMEVFGLKLTRILSSHSSILGKSQHCECFLVTSKHTLVTSKHILVTIMYILVTSKYILVTSKHRKLSGATEGSHMAELENNYHTVKRVGTVSRTDTSHIALLDTGKQAFCQSAWACHP